MTGALSPSHWVIILVVVLLLFGAKRLPDAARGLGRSMRILKAETTAMSDDDSQPGDDTETSKSRTGVAAPGKTAAPAKTAVAGAVPAAVQTAATTSESGSHPSSAPSSSATASSRSA